MDEALLLASDFSDLGTPFIIPFFLGGMIALVAAVVFAVRTRWYYSLPALVILWPVSAIILFVLELGVLFVHRWLSR